MPSKSQIYNVSSDIASPSEIGLYGHLEVVTPSGMTGWLVDLENRGSTLTAYIRGIPVASGSLQIWRQDVADIIGRPTAYGFQVVWQSWNLSDLAFSESDVLPLVFGYGEKLFVFANHPDIDGATLISVQASFPKTGPASGEANLERMIREGLDAEIGAPSAEGVRLIAFYEPNLYPMEGSSSAGPWVELITKKQEGMEVSPVPGEIGFYDPRSDETRQLQASLAAQYGISGFCYRYYLRNGRPYATRPLVKMLKSGIPNFPFCICLCAHQDLELEEANQPSPEEYQGIINEIVACVLDPRYIRVNEAPLLIVEKQMPLTGEIIAAVREACKGFGISRLYLCNLHEENNPVKAGFDASIEVLPTSAATNFFLNADDYRSMAFSSMGRSKRAWKQFPKVSAKWNVDKASLDIYEIWLRSAIEFASSSLPDGEQLVFIESWNDWRKGAFLEPDQNGKRARLEATARALFRNTDWRALIELGKGKEELKGREKDRLFQDLAAQCAQMQLQLDWYEQLYATGSLPVDISQVREGQPLWAAGLRLVHGGEVCFDQVGNVPQPAIVPVSSRENLYCSGWGFIQNVKLDAKTPTCLVLLDPDDESILYNGFIPKRLPRGDISGLYPNISTDATWFAGFNHIFGMGLVKQGIYRLGLLTRSQGVVYLSGGNVSIEVS